MSDQKIGERIREVRLSAGLSQAEFGAKIGVSLPTVVRVEKGVFGLRLDFVQTVAQCFGCDLGWLITGERRAIGTPVLRSLEPSGRNELVGHLMVPGLDGQGVGLVVVGDDAVPTVRPGDVVVVTDATIASGDLVAYCSRWKDVRVRRYVEVGDERRLVAEMPGMPDITIADGLKVYGRVSYVVRCTKV